MSNQLYILKKNVGVDEFYHFLNGQGLSKSVPKSRQDTPVSFLWTTPWIGNEGCPPICRPIIKQRRNKLQQNGIHIESFTNVLGNDNYWVHVLILECWTWSATVRLVEMQLKHDTGDQILSEVPTARVWTPPPPLVSKCVPWVACDTSTLWPLVRCYMLHSWMQNVFFSFMDMTSWSCEGSPSIKVAVKDYKCLDSSFKQSRLCSVHVSVDSLDLIWTLWDKPFETTCTLHHFINVLGLDPKRGDVSFIVESISNSWASSFSTAA